MRVYFAGPLFSEAEKRFNLALTERIEALGHEVFLPQRDGFEVGRPERAAMSPDEIRRTIFALDTDEVLAADLLLIVLDGRVPDEGAAFELGLAWGHKRLARPDKRIAGLMTDVRASFIGGKLNPMLGQALDALFEDEDSLLTWLADPR